MYCSIPSHRAILALCIRCVGLYLPSACLPSAFLQLLSTTLTEAVAKLLDNNKSPSRKGKELDNRGSSFYIAQYVWAATPKQHHSTFSR